MKYLIIKASYRLNNENKVSTACVPYEFGKCFDLPNEYPFNQNVYFGPDDGAFLGRIYIDQNGKIDYLSDIIVLKDNKATYSPSRSGRYSFEFEVVDK